MVDSRETYILPKFKKSILCEHKLYFSSYNYNGFFSVDLETGEAVLEGVIVGESGHHTHCKRHKAPS